MAEYPSNLKIYYVCIEDRAQTTQYYLADEIDIQVNYNIDRRFSAVKC